MRRLLWLLAASIVGTLAGCASPPAPERVPAAPPSARQPAPRVPAPADDLARAANVPGDTAPLPPPLVQGKSRWVAVRWAELPGFGDDALHEAWNAWIKSCERPGPTFAALCTEVRQLSIGEGDEQRAFMVRHLQPYRVEALAGPAEGLLTGYYEPVFEASRTPRAGMNAPLYRPPATLASRKPWYTRQEIDQLPEARAALRGREIAYLADPIDVLVLQIQGSGRLKLTEPDGSERMVRVSFAGTNDQPYRSVNQWLLSQGVTRIAPWPQATKDWAARNPDRVNELLWSNPRYVFFRDEPIAGLDAAFGPRGAQGVPLTPGRSIAVDPQSIPYGTPVWLASSGPTARLARLVFAQDTGSAIVGAVRADYFAGTGEAAGQLAAQLKQPLALWVLWPRR